MILSMLALGLVLGLARARWWGALLAGGLFIVQIAMSTDNAWYTFPVSGLLGAINAAVGWGLGWLIARGIASLWSRVRASASSGHDDGPLPQEQAAA